MAISKIKANYEVDQTPGNSYTFNMDGLLAWCYVTGAFVNIPFPFVTRNTNYTVYYDAVTALSDVGDMGSMVASVKTKDRLEIKLPYTADINVVRRCGGGKIRIVFA